jgi:hypothetical protein
VLQEPDDLLVSESRFFLPNPTFGTRTLLALPWH